MKKLIVTIPVYNEEENIADVIREIPREIQGVGSVEVLVYDDGSTDRTREAARAAGATHVVGRSTNKGLAITFKEALWAALERGADIIVNTDGDNHYNQSRIPDLVKPILEGHADITIGSRKVNDLEEMPFWNKHLNRIGSYVVTKWIGLPNLDVSTGFRGYSKDAALKLGVYSLHTYVHTTLLSAQDLNLTITEVPIKARAVSRESRLIKSIPNHLWKAGINIIRNIVLFRPLRFFGVIAFVLFLIGALPVGRFLYYYAIGNGGGHIQSLVLAGVLIILSFNSLMLGLLGSSIGWSRKVTEETLYFLKKREIEKKNQQTE
ncbi:MAG: glycosyltransferase family 2 protein [Candidatus Kerfeldbacteria bacterium]